jgi:hypothetical protein
LNSHIVPIHGSLCPRRDLANTVDDFSGAIATFNHGVSALPRLEVGACAADAQQCNCEYKCESVNHALHHKRSVKPIDLVQAKIHSLKDQRANRRIHLPGYTAWEIHPVMKIESQ